MASSIIFTLRETGLPMDAVRAPQDYRIDHTGINSGAAPVHLFIYDAGDWVEFAERFTSVDEARIFARRDWLSN